MDRKETGRSHGVVHASRLSLDSENFVFQSLLQTPQPHPASVAHQQLASRKKQSLRIRSFAGSLQLYKRVCRRTFSSSFQATTVQSSASQPTAKRAPDAHPKACTASSYRRCQLHDVRAHAVTDWSLLPTAEHKTVCSLCETHARRNRNLLNLSSFSAA